MRLGKWCWLCLLIWSGTSWAKELTDYEIVNFDQLPKIEEDAIDMQDVASIIPYHRLQQGDTGQILQRKILDQSVNSFLKSDMIQQSGVGQAAKSVEDGVKTDIAFGGGKDSDVQHKFSVQYQAFQNEARIRYSGYANLNLRYRMDNATYEAQWIHELEGKQLVFSRQVQLIEELQNIDRTDVSSVSLQWTW